MLRQGFMRYSHPPSHPLTRRLRVLYVLALGTVALLAICSQPLIQHYLVEQAVDVRISNVARRQRMLSQKLAKAALAHELADTPWEHTRTRAELSSTADEWEQAHRKSAMGISKVTSPEVRQGYGDLEPFHQMMLRAARALTSGVELPQAARQKQLGAILTGESRFLNGMNQIISLYEAEERGRVENLERLELLLLGAMLVVLAMEAWFIFRPASRALDATLEDLLQTQKQLSESEKRLRLLFGQITDGLILHELDNRCRIIDVNERTCAMLGYTREELLALSVADIEQNFPADRVPLVERLGGSECLTCEGFQIRKDGTTLPVEMQIRLCTVEGRPLVMALARDITARRQTEAALTQKEQLLRSFYNSAAMMMGIVEVQGGRLVHISGNAATARFFGRALEEMENRSVSEQLGTPRPVERQWITACIESQQRDTPVNFRYEREHVFGQRSISSTVCFIGLSAAGHRQFSYIADDVTEQMCASAALLDSERRYRQLVEVSPDAIFVQSGGHFVFANSACLEMLGAQTAEQVIGRSVFDFIWPENRPMVEEHIRRLLEGHKEIPLEDRFVRLDGSTVEVQVSAVLLTHDGQTAFLVVARDISELKRTQAALEGRVRRETLLAQITQEIRMSLEADRIYQTTAEQIGRAFGADRCVIHSCIDEPEIRLPIVAEYLAGDTPSILNLEMSVEATLHMGMLLVEDRAVATPDVLAEPLLDGAVTGVRAMLAIRTSYQGVPNGAIVLHWCGGVQNCSAEQIELLEAVAAQVGIAITQARLLEQEVQQRGLLSWQATHDPLTGLVNRRSFESRLADALREVRREQAQHTLMYLDLDQFKVVNDTCGHAAGDELLRQVSTLLQSAVRHNDLLARLGGDEFGILLWECPATDGLVVAETLIEALRQYRFAWQGNSFTVGASIGVAAIDAHFQDPTHALIAADTACSASKDAGRNRAILWRADDQELRRRSDEIQWAPRLQQALEENRFCLYYQPIVATTSTDAIDAADARYEVLLRMVDEDGGIVPPMAFLPTAERYHQMGAIDRWVVSTLFSFLSGNRPTLPPQGCYFVNLSSATVGDERFVDFVGDQLRQHRVDPQQLCFEITETVAIANLSRAAELIAQLKAFGCHFALDDFGSGTNSFNYLKSLPVDVVKIDGEFIRDLASDPLDRAIVESISRIAQLLGLTTVAEFVENEAILLEVRALGIDFVQGYGIGRPEAVPRMPRLPSSLPQPLLQAGCEQCKDEKTRNHAPTQSIP